MDEKYSIGGGRAAIAMTCAANDAEARLIHYGLQYGSPAAPGLPLPVRGKAVPAAPPPRPSRSPPSNDTGERRRHRPGGMPRGPSLCGH